MVQQFKSNVGREELVIEIGKLAKQANGAVTVKYGGTVVLVTAVMSGQPRPDAGFFPLTVEYQEKTYAAGKIPGGFFRREGRPTEKETLTARLIDRPIRPLFPDGMLNEVQIVGIVLSSDGENNPDVLAIIGASCALSISDIPFSGPLGAFRVGKVNGNLIISPTYKEIEEGDFEMVVVGNREGVVMVEGSAKQVPEEEIFEAIEFARGKIPQLLDFQDEIIRACGRQKSEIHLKESHEELITQVRELTRDRLVGMAKLPTKEEREDYIDSIARELEEKLVNEESGIEAKHVREAVTVVEQEVVRERILKEGIRIDGRDSKTVRPITCEVGVLPRTHGSGLFTRGQTQSLSVATLGTSEDEQLIEALEGESYKSFMLHYSFPPFSVGEVKPIRGPGRREIGHGVLAERALRAVMPTKEEFPYTIRVVSEILESNGSSSMATVCAGALALMDAGVPIKAPVAGIAMGLFKDENRAIILTDILGLEDHFGDMDFKLTGTRKGVTAMQMDVKIGGLSGRIINDTLLQAREARMFVLDRMAEVLAEPRPALSQYAPRIQVIYIKPERIKDVIGPGGRIIKSIIAQTGVIIECEDDGKITVASPDLAAAERAINIIRELTMEVEVGKVYKGKVTRLMNFGAFCEVLPGKEGLVHISELSNKYVGKVEDVVKIGDEFDVKVIEIDSQGRVNLSRKALMGPPEPGETPAESGRRPERGGRPPRGRFERPPRSDGKGRG